MLNVDMYMMHLKGPGGSMS